MEWIILGIVFLVVTIWSLRGATIAEYDATYRVYEHHIPVWILVIAFMVYCIPALGIMAFVLYHVWFLALANIKPHDDDYSYWVIELSDKNTLHKLYIRAIKYLTREI